MRKTHVGFLGGLVAVAALAGLCFYTAIFGVRSMAPQAGGPMDDSLTSVVRMGASEMSEKTMVESTMREGMQPASMLSDSMMVPAMEGKKMSEPQGSMAIMMNSSEKK